MEVKKDRVALWDNAKFFLILLVVLGHSTIWETESSHVLSSAFLFIYSFHMPLFIFLSGLFFSNRNITAKVVSFFSIYVVSKLFMFGFSSFTTGTYELKLFDEGEFPWFVFVLAVYILVTYGIRDLNLKYILVLVTVLALFAGYDQTLTDKFVLARTVTFYPFYLLGVVLPREILEKQAKNKYCKIAGWTILIIAAICFWFFTDKLYILRHIFTGRNVLKRRYGNTDGCCSFYAILLRL